jgi:DNA-binding beta-propeller fold protein YncE
VGELVSGLPDEAGDARGQVKAWIAANLADQLVAAGVAVFDHASDGHGSSVLYGRGPFPAGVYVSDGEGKVTLADDLERVIEGLVNAIHGLDSYAELGGAPMERTMRANGAVADARDFLAALSATDTEGTDGR